MIVLSDGTIRKLLPPLMHSYLDKLGAVDSPIGMQEVPASGGFQFKSLGEQLDCGFEVPIAGFSHPCQPQLCRLHRSCCWHCYTGLR